MYLHQLARSGIGRSMFEYSLFCIFFCSSCKKADAILLANDFLRKPYGQKYDWVIFLDDDVYLFPDNLQRMILDLGKEKASQLKAFGNYGCGHKDCVGFCGGSGYMLTRHAVLSLANDVQPPYNSFRDQEIYIYDKPCGRCGDLVVTRVMLDRRKITTEGYGPGHFGFHMGGGRNALENSLRSTSPRPWLYHYPAKGNMDFIFEKASIYKTNYILEE